MPSDRDEIDKSVRTEDASILSYDPQIFMTLLSTIFMSTGVLSGPKAPKDRARITGCCTILHKFVLHTILLHDPWILGCVNEAIERRAMAGSKEDIVLDRRTTKAMF